MKRIALAVALLALVVGACANKTAGGSGSSGIQGHVVIGPTCPVEIAGSPCPPAPFAAKITVKRDGNVVRTFETGTDGRFRIPLEPGTYTIEAQGLNQNPIQRMQPLPPVTVRQNGFTGVTISFDSGIR